MLPGHHRKATTQQTAKRHRSDVVTRVCTQPATSLLHQPKLRQYGANAREKPSHPEGVKNWVVIHVAVQQSGKNEAADEHRADRECVLCFGSAATFNDAPENISI